MDLIEDPLVKLYIQSHDLKPNSIRNFKRSMKLYSEFIGMKPNEWIKEAEDEEEDQIRMSRRKIKSHLLDFRDFLYSQDYTLLTVRTTMMLVRAMYTESEIQLPKVKLKTDKRQESKEDIPGKKEIEFALKYVNPKYKAIILLMSSSGMGASEIASLNMNDFLISLKDDISIPNKGIVDMDELIELVAKRRKENPLMIPTWRITRIKTEMPYITFSSPESLTAILDYLKIHPAKNNDYLFRGPHNTKIGLDTFYRFFHRLNTKCEFGKPDRQVFFRSHNLRKYFASTISEEIPFLKVERMLGHKVKDQTNSYFKTDLVELKAAYIKAIPSIAIMDTEVQVLKSEDKKLLNKLLLESDEMKEEIKILKRMEERRKQLE